MSKEHDRQIYSQLVDDYKSLLTNAFINWDETYTYSYSKIDDILHSLDLSNDEFCKLHWKRIKNAIIGGGITIEDIGKIYGNISFLRNNACKSLPRYRKYLSRKDSHIELKKRIECLLISG
jgi:hypothetical protein